MRYTRQAVLATAALLLAGLVALPARADVSFDFAYSNLSQHGSWLVSAQYGHVWQPREYNREWNPYYDGHWVDTDMGWTWVSDYSWGAIPYHYGTWVADPDDGWVWIPGSVWAPSWVVFRSDSSYIGWAPVPPGFSVGMSMDMGGLSSFVFVSSRDFLAPSLRTAIIPSGRTNVFFNQTTVINNFVVQNNFVNNRGPDVRIIERATGRTIHQQRIESVARVAPFARVSRAQLTVAPERVRQGFRVAEPVPASRPLPGADKRGIRQASTTPAGASRPQDRRTAARPNTPTPAAAGMPVRTTQTPQQARAPQASPRQARANTQRKASGRAPANAQQTPAPQASPRQARANTQQRASGQAPANAQQARRPQASPRQARANTQQRATEQAPANAQQARRSQAPARAAVVPATPVARGAAQGAKPQQKAEVRADPKNRKDNPDQKKQGPDKGAGGAKEQNRE